MNNNYCNNKQRYTKSYPIDINKLFDFLLERQLLIVILGMFLLLLSMLESIAQDSGNDCLPHQYNVCTQPIMPVIVCPDFCLSDAYEIIETGAIFDCSLTIMGNCIQYIALPGFIATDQVYVVACSATACDTSYINFDVIANADDCATTEVIEVNPMCTIENMDFCTQWYDTLNICPTFCFAEEDDYFIGQVNSANPSDMLINSQCFSYIPTAETVSWDNIEVVACDFVGNCDTIFIDITLGDCDAPPIPSPSQLCTEPFTPVELCFDMAAGEIYNASDIVTTFECTLTPHAATCVTYYPLPGFTGIDSVSVPICQYDNPSNCREEIFVIQVGCVAPLVQDDIISITPTMVSINEDSTATTLGMEGVDFELINNDQTICPSFFATYLINPPANGQVTAVTANTFTYIPNINFNGSDTATFEICNECSLCSSSVVYFNVSNPTENVDTITTVNTYNSKPPSITSQPNPCTDYLQLSVKNMDNQSLHDKLIVRLYNASGTIVQLTTYNGEQETVFFDMSDYSSGIYFIEATIGQKLWIEKVVKQ